MKPATDVWATNGRGEKRRFTRISWDLLGKNKEGWTELPDTVIQNQIDSPAKPSTGNKTQVIENTATAEKNNQVIENIVVSAAKEEAANVVESETGSPSITKEQKDEFLKAAQGLKKGDIKDFFDKQNPAVEYSNSWKPQAFIEKLAEYLNYDIVELQKAFN